MALPDLNFDPWFLGLRIHAAHDFTRHGITVKANDPIPCRLCGRSDRWLRESRAYVCEHGTIDGFPIRKLDSIPLNLVGEVDEAQD